MTRPPPNERIPSGSPAGSRLNRPTRGERALGRRAEPWLLALLLAASACTASGPAPALTAVEPSGVERDVAVELVLRGGEFRPKVRLDFDRPSQSEVDAAFSVQVGEAVAEQVRWLDASTLTARFAGFPAAGTYDVVVVDPRGAQARLAAAFTVSEPSRRVSVETRPDGTGTRLAVVVARLGARLPLFALSRDAQQNLLGPVAVDWGLTGQVATATSAAGPATTLEATALGDGTLTASAPNHLPALLAVRVVPCVSDADCRDACHPAATCEADGGACASGASTKDSDFDGAIDAACPGGEDCDDADGSVHPGALEAPPGSPACRDGRDDDCDGLIDFAQASCQPDSAPLAAFTLTPGAVSPGDTVVADASPTVDREEPTAGLAFEWDWDGDGAFEAQGLTSAHAFAAAGRAVVTLRATDSQGLSSLTTRPLFVVAPEDLAVVTIDAEEADPGATPTVPGGTGLSLREALRWAEQTAGAQTVLLPPGRVVGLGAGVTTGATAVTVVGFGAALDGAGAGAVDCLTVAGPAEVVGLEVRGCRGAGVAVTGARAQVAWCSLHHDGVGAALRGADAVFGPGNDVAHNAGPGVTVEARATVVDSAVHAQAGPGVEVHNGGDGTRILGVRLYDNGQGVDLLAQADGVELWHDVFVANGVGLRGAVSAGGLDVRNNIFSGQRGWAIDVGAGALTAIDANDFFQNAGACRRCTTLGPRSLGATPEFVSAAAEDFRPSVLSPILDRGVDLGVDRNGAWPGLFLGPAPDLGAFEVR